MKTSGDKIKKPVVMISMDAAEPSLIEKWTTDGSMPVLAGIRAKSAYARLKSTAFYLAGSVWPAFYTGTTPFVNNIYNYIQWNYKESRLMKPNPDWLPARPFWRHISNLGVNILVFDIPFTYLTEPVNGLEITGLTTVEHTTYPSFYPGRLKKYIYSKYGKPVNIFEPYGLTSFAELMNLRSKLIDAIKYVENISIDLIHKYKAELIIINFQSCHTTGHKFWNTSHLNDSLSHDQIEEFSNSLKLVYQTCDSSIGNILDAIGEYSNLFLYSLHGMGVNTSRSDVLPVMLDQILNVDRKINYGNIINKARKLVSLEFRSKVKSLLPINFQDFLTQYWRNQELDWNRCKTVNMVMDLQALIRLNLKGREHRGVVNENEYDALCNRIIEGLKDYKDIDTGETIIDNVFSLKDYNGSIPYESHIPDLIINWVNTPNTIHRAFKSNMYGTVKWPTPGYSPDGRSGNHMPEGFLIFQNHEINNELFLKNPHILDIAPTVYRLFDFEIPKEMKGTPFI